MKPPFPSVPAFVIVATILSYYGYQQRAKALLRRMNQNSILYWKNHEHILKGFLTLKPALGYDTSNLNGSNWVFGRRTKNRLWNISKEWYQEPEKKDKTEEDRSWKPAPIKSCAKTRILQAWDCKFKVGGTLLVTQEGYGKTAIKASFDDLKLITPSRSLLTTSHSTNYCLCGSCTVNNYPSDPLKPH